MPVVNYISIDAGFRFIAISLTGGHISDLQTLPDLRSSCVAEGQAQVQFWAGWN
jgi:hypothetical protein